MNSHETRNISGAVKVELENSKILTIQFLHDFFPDWNRKSQLARFAYVSPFSCSKIVSQAFFRSDKFVSEQEFYLFITSGYKTFQIWLAGPDVIQKYLSNPETLDYDPDIYNFPKSGNWVLRYMDEWIEDDFRLLILDTN